MTTCVVSGILPSSERNFDNFEDETTWMWVSFDNCQRRDNLHDDDVTRFGETTCILREFLKP
jgi:hypothetical protein